MSIPKMSTSCFLPHFLIFLYYAYTTQDYSSTYLIKNLKVIVFQTRKKRNINLDSQGRRIWLNHWFLVKAGGQIISLKII